MQIHTGLLLLASSAALTVAAPAPVSEDLGLINRQSSYLKGFDVSQPKTSGFWSCMAQQGYQKVAIRGYQQACKVGGMVDHSFAPSYQAAVQAGITNIDAYFFPCTGTQQSKYPACKSPSQQLAEFEQAMSSSGMTITQRWFDIEPGPQAGPCNAWNLGSAANLQLVQEWVQLLKSSGNSWGVYANGNEWTRMFATQKTDIGASDLPFWAVQVGKANISTVTVFPGSWTSASARQYKEDVDEPACKGKVDLDSFSS